MHTVSTSHGLPYHHIGGDEIAGEAWKGSPICQNTMPGKNINNLKDHFLRQVADIIKGVFTSILTCLNFRDTININDIN